MNSEPLLARQPVFDRLLDVVGYELLFRGQLPVEMEAGMHQGELMTAQLMIDAFILGIERLTGGKRLFINADRRVLTGELPIVFPPERTVIEILKSVVVDSEVLDGCRSLIESGYVLALDDFSWFDDAESLLGVASFVKIDIRKFNIDEMFELVESLRKFDVKLIALKVESWAELEVCTELGFDYFQGYVLSRPQLVEGKTLTPSNLTNLKLAAQLSDVDASLDTISDIVRTDPALSFRVLQASTEGTYYGTLRTVRSLNEALVILGWRRLQAWVTLMLLVEPKALPSERVSSVLVRARLCELIAVQIDSDLANAAYTTGLLSCLDVLLGISIEEALRDLPIDPEIVAAVLRMEGILGRVLAEAEFLLLGISSMETEAEGAPWTGMLDPKTLQVAYLEAVEWGDATGQALLNSDAR